MLLFFAFFGNLVATALILFASLAILASLYFFLQSKHVRRGDIVPFSMFTRKWLSNPKHASISVLHPRHRVVGVSIVDGGDDDEIAEIE